MRDRASGRLQTHRRRQACHRTARRDRCEDEERHAAPPQRRYEKGYDQHTDNRGKRGNAHRQEAGDRLAEARGFQAGDQALTRGEGRGARGEGCGTRDLLISPDKRSWRRSALGPLTTLTSPETTDKGATTAFQ